MTPERDRMVEREHSRLQRLDMTGTDECRNSRSRSGTPSRHDNVVPQPDFQSGLSSHSHGDTPQDPGPLPRLPQMHLPEIGDDPFRVYIPAQHAGIINLNDDGDVPQIQNAPQQGANMPGPLSQEGRQFQWQIPPYLPSQPPVPTQPPMPIPLQQPVPIQPPIPIPSPAQIVGGVRHALANRQYVGHAARQQHPRWSNKLWCTKGRHWVESAVFGRLLTCETC